MNKKKTSKNYVLEVWLFQKTANEKRNKKQNGMNEQNKLCKISKRQRQQQNATILWKRIWFSKKFCFVAGGRTKIESFKWKEKHIEHFVISDRHKKQKHCKIPIHKKTITGLQQLIQIQCSHLHLPSKPKKNIYICVILWVKKLNNDGNTRIGRNENISIGIFCFITKPISMVVIDPSSQN